MSIPSSVTFYCEGAIDFSIFLLKMTLVFSLFLSAALLLPGISRGEMETPSTSIEWKSAGDPTDPPRATWCEGSEVWREGEQGLQHLVKDCAKNSVQKRCELVTVVRQGRLASTAQCVSY